MICPPAGPSVTTCQDAPPSWVAYSLLPTTQPLDWSANRMVVTWPGAYTPVAVPIGAFGAGMPCQVLPPSLVRTMDVQGALEQGAVPSAQPCEASMKVADTGVNRAGTGPPAGPTADGVAEATGLVETGAELAGVPGAAEDAGEVGTELPPAIGVVADLCELEPHAVTKAAAAARLTIRTGCRNTAELLIGLERHRVRPLPV